MKILLATRNPGKMNELIRLLKIPDAAFSSLLDHPDVSPPPEDRNTYAGNALAKALAVCQMTGLTTVADDSGLEVDVLGRRPGIRSARYGGEGLTDLERAQVVLGEMREIEWKMRGARFRCVLALVTPQGQKELVEGECQGVIGFFPQGKGGFGYDPIFVLPGLDRTMAEFSPEEKDTMSHRADAARKLLPILRNLSQTISPTY